MKNEGNAWRVLFKLPVFMGELLTLKLDILDTFVPGFRLGWANLFNESVI